MKFEREAGFYLGSIYFNYGLTALIVAIAYPVLKFNRVLPPTVNLGGLVLSDKWLLMGGCVLFAVFFPMWFFRYARALWLGFDQYWDPREDESPDDNQPPVDPKQLNTPAPKREQGSKALNSSDGAG